MDEFDLAGGGGGGAELIEFLEATLGRRDGGLVGGTLV